MSHEILVNKGFTEEYVSKQSIEGIHRDNKDLPWYVMVGLYRIRDCILHEWTYFRIQYANMSNHASYSGRKLGPTVGREVKEKIFLVSFNVHHISKFHHQGQVVRGGGVDRICGFPKVPK
jgi:hypothetical protein